MNIEKNIKSGIQLADYTHYKIGGPADFFITVTNSDELKNAVQWAIEKKLPYMIMGGGSNILILDKGIRGLVIKTENKNIKIEKNKVTAESGVVLMNLVNLLAEKGLSGLEFACGIYGTVGGAIYGNAGSFGKEIKGSLITATAFHPDYGQKIFNNQECLFTYRSSKFKLEQGWVILAGEFELKVGKPSVLKQQIKDMIQKKLVSQPMELPSSGCIFKNPILDKQKLQELKKHFAKETDQTKFWQDNSLAAGFLIERAGLKGKKIGAAQVSNKHASFIVNTGQATAEQVIMLISFIKQQVRDKYGVQLQEEIEILGE